ncbi:MAG: 3-phosphoshikimate 1-carboxyvinyltransferase, partial [Armatimonadota bacterium]
VSAGTTTVRGYLASQDCLNTLRCMQFLGAEVSVDTEPGLAPGTCRVEILGRGSTGLSEPPDILDVGNSGTGIRLISGVLAGQPFFSVITGDEQVRRRPMRRIVEPLRMMGAEVWGRANGSLAPLAVRGGGLKGIRYRSPVASAQVKSALLLAGLFAEGETVVEEPAKSRDHTERIMPVFGAELRVEGNTVAVKGGAELLGRQLNVPGDFSSAAYFIVAALLVPDSDLVIENVGVNPTRTGLLDVLQEMGGDVRIANVRDEAGEPVGDIAVRTSQLRGVQIGGAVIPRLLDEVPILAVAAAYAEGETTVRDAQELRVKETDRLRTTVEMIRALGGEAEETEDGLRVHGTGRLKGGECDSYGDHRIAMSAAVAGLAADSETRVLNTECIATSFPGFGEMLRDLTGGCAVNNVE